uniref:ATP synthase membrane subunit j n=1 Tax=Maylandia zebra TaxID=106582 RepID=A0A3P9B7Y2_9CICH
MAGRAFASWWSLMSPYYTKAYQEMWAGVGIMTYLYYKVSYGGEFKTSLLLLFITLY